MKKSLKKINETGEYPDIKEIPDMYKIFWILKVMGDKLRTNKLPAGKISDLLWEEFHINLKPLSIKRICARVGKKIKPFRKDKEIQYALTNNGEQELMSLSKGIIAPKKTKKAVFSNSTIKKLGNRFKEDLRELRVIYSFNCGTCVAFMLRKILEKTIYLKFAKHNMIDELKNPDRKFFGLSNMLKISVNKKINGIPILTQKTYEKLSTSKFLGDTAAHNFKTNVPIEMVRRELSYIEIALRELLS